MRAIFLCGGIGKRMMPITKDKGLLRFCGKELVLRQLELAEKYAEGKPVLICSPLNIEDIKKVVGDRAEYAIQEEPRGMADAVLSAKKFLRGEVVIIGANDVFEESAYESIKKAKGDAAILAVKVTKYFPGGYLVTDGSRVTGIMEKPGEGNEPSDLVNVVFHKYKSGEGLVECLEFASSSRDDVYEVALTKMCGEKEVVAVPYTGYWGAIKYPFHILGVSRHFLSKMEPRVSKKASIAASAVIKGNTVIEDGASVFENAVIVDSYIGRDAVVANNALVRESHVDDNSVVGFSTELARSYVGCNVWFHNNYVGDSVVMDNSMFGSGCVTANFRFDEKEVYMEVGGEKVGTGANKFGCIVGANCKTGINSSIYPGIKIGEYSFIGPGIVLRESIEPHTVVLLAQQWQKKKLRSGFDPSAKLGLMKRLKK
ncbi:MAG: NTP transferase domain-containing protein [Candidatus Diapherotrites archaeon]|nr:NTP transferase domain-containing protein [Candidatus Diapherotrites archaeon]